MNRLRAWLQRRRRWLVVEPSELWGYEEASRHFTMNQAVEEAKDKDFWLHTTKFQVMRRDEFDRANANAERTIMKELSEPRPYSQRHEPPPSFY